MPQTSAEKMRKRREKLKSEGKYEEYKLHVKEAVKKSRIKKKNKMKTISPVTVKKLVSIEREKNRKRVKNWRNKQKSAETSDMDISSSPYSCASTLGKATAKVRRSLPQCPLKKKAVLTKLLNDADVETKPDDTAYTSSKSHKSGLPKDVLLAVQEFYAREDISRQAPGIKDFVTVKTPSGDKKKLQVRHLYSSLKETHALFVQEKGEVIGKSKFSELRPQNVLLSSKLPHNVCLCRYHENYAIAVNAMHGVILTFPRYDNTFVASVICKTQKPECWLRECDHCLSLLNDKFVECLMAMDNLPHEVTWYVWKDVEGKLSKVLECGTIADLQNYILEMTPQFFLHSYVKRNQAESYQKDRTAISGMNFDPAVAMLQVDFAENYTCIAQDEIQSFHWAQPQVTLFTVSVWFGGKQHAVVIVSDDRHHNKDTVIVYMDKILQELPESIKEAHIWSDGPASQFKNRYVAAGLETLEKRSGKTIIWNYFATSHGKGPVDGIGGALKRSVRNMVLRREATVFNALQFAAAAEKSSVKIIYMLIKEIEERFKAMKLQEIFDGAPIIPGISKSHIMFLQNGRLEKSLISSNVGKSIKEKIGGRYVQNYGSSSESDSDYDSDDVIPLAQLKHTLQKA